MVWLHATCDHENFLEQLVTSKAYRRGAFASLQIASGAAGIANATPERSQSFGSGRPSNCSGNAEKQNKCNRDRVDARKAYEAARDAWRKTQGERAAVRTELDVAEAAMLAAHKKSTDAANVFAAAQKKHADNAARVAHAG